MACKRNTRTQTKNLAQFNEATTTRDNKNRSYSCGGVGKSVSRNSTASYGELCVLTFCVPGGPSLPLKYSALSTFIFIGSQLWLCITYFIPKNTHYQYTITRNTHIIIVLENYSILPDWALQIQPAHSTTKEICLIVCVLPQPPWGLTAMYSYAFL